MKFEKDIKMKPIKDHRKKAIINIMYTGNMLTDNVIQLLKKYNINDQHFNVLRIVKGRYPGSVTPGEIKEVLLNKRGDLTRLLDKLEGFGWVKRENNAENRRTVDITMTKVGVKALEKINKEFDVESPIEKNITVEEAKELNRILDKLRG